MSAISIIVTAAYIIRIINRVFFGNVPAELEGHLHDVNVLDKIAVVVLCVVMIVRRVSTRRS